MSYSVEVALGTNTRELAGNLCTDNSYEAILELIAEIDETYGDMEFTRRLHALAVDRLNIWAG